jgi:hypothetical protein
MPAVPGPWVVRNEIEITTTSSSPNSPIMRW